MKILHLAATLEGGAGIGLLRYHEALRAAGADSRLLVARRPATTPRNDVAVFGWRKRPLPARLLLRLGVDLGRAARLRRALAARQAAAPGAGYELFTSPHSEHRPEDHPWVADADVVNLHWVAGALDWSRFCRRVSRPLVLTLHDQQPYLGGFHYVRDAELNPALAHLDAQVREVKRRALAGRRLGVVANSHWNADEARRSAFFSADTPIETFHYPLDPEVYHPSLREGAKAALGLPPAPVVVGFASDSLGNPRKGFDLLLDALDALPAPLRQSLALLSFGRPAHADLAARVGLPWKHLGRLDGDTPKARAYAAMDIFVAPSRAEAFGLTALEAQAVGTAVVATRVGGLAEAAVHAVEPEPAALAADLAALVADPALRARRAEAGRRLVLARHDPREIGPRLAAFHAALLR